MQTAKDIAASAKAGMEKTKATLQEKVQFCESIDWCFYVDMVIWLEQGERMTAHDPLQKEMATEKKEAKIHEAERRKHEERRHNAAVADHGGGHDQHVVGGHKHTTGTDYTGTGYGTGGTY